MKCRMKRVASLFLALALCAGMTMNVGAVTVQEAENKADELEGKKEQAEAEAKDLTEKLKGIVADMEETQKKLTEKEEEIEQVENELVQAQIDANDQYERMKVRIKYMYESGNTQFVAVLAESKNMGDFLNKAEYISQISEYDRDELIRYQDTVEEIEVKEEEVQAEYEELNTLQTKLVGQQTEVQKMIDENKEKLSNIQSEIDANAAALEKAKEVERIQQEQAGNNYIPSTGGNVVSGNGYFTHPCPGMSYQSSYFGEIRPYEVGGVTGLTEAGHAQTAHAAGMLFCQQLRDRGTHAAVDAVLLNGEDHAGLGSAGENGLLVQGLDAHDVDDLCGDALLSEELGSLQGVGQLDAACHDGRSSSSASSANTS